MSEESSHRLLRLKLMRLEREKVRHAHIQANKSNIYIFTPKNDLEVAAIAIATEGDAGWKGSLFSLNYFDRYLEHTCFIFATQHQESTNQQWLLVNFDSRADAKYWIALGQKLLSDVYYSWARVVRKPNPQFNLQHLKGIQYQDFI